MEMQHTSKSASPHTPGNTTVLHIPQLLQIPTKVVISGDRQRQNNRSRILWIGDSNSVQYSNRSKGTCKWTKAPHGIIANRKHLYPIPTMLPAMLT
eukprot:15295526-Ditylum_brightwellii.AAC.1